MAKIPLNLPPGVVRPGTVYDAKGRWYSAPLVRWVDGVMQPIGGWSVLAGAGSVDITGAPRKIIAWRRNNGDAKLAIATNSEIYVYADGTATSIAPGDLTTGPADASGTYWSRVEAETWQLDTYGEDLVGVGLSDGRILYWDSSAGGLMSAVANAPTGCAGVLVTPERFLVALGADSDPRKVAWADQDDIEDWTAAVTNQAGDKFLAGNGRIMAGHRGRGESLIWTDTSIWAMRYVGGDFIYRFKEMGTNCGPISRNSMAVVGPWSMWMGQKNFYMYDGSVKSIQSEISDYVFNDLNRTQASKIWAEVRADFEEIWWHYSSEGSTECDRVVGVNWDSGEWMIGPEGFERTAGCDRQFLEYPVAADASGAVYFHENGTTYQDEGGSPSYTPSAVSGPVELGAGDRVMRIQAIIPSEETTGEVQLSLLTAFYPNGTETETGPFTAAAKTDCRVTGRQARLKLEQVTGGWRFGTPRLEIEPGGER